MKSLRKQYGNPDSHLFFVRIMHRKKKCQDVTLCKKSLSFLKKYYFSDRHARKYSKSKTDFKNVFLRDFRDFESQFYISGDSKRLSLNYPCIKYL